MDEMDWSLLTRYLNGSCTEVERRQVVRWAQERPENERFIRRMRNIWRISSASRVDRPPDEEYLSSDWKRFKKKMRSGEDAQSEETAPLAAAKATDGRVSDGEASQPGFAGSSFSYAVRVAAIVLVTLGGVALFASQSGDRSEPEAAQAEETRREAVTKPGQRGQLTLSDETEVQLNVDSKLRYPRVFTGPRRVVWLSGEAFFDVRSDSARPFIVHANGATVRVRGTAFGVRAYQEEEVKVVVTEGAVDLSVETTDANRRDSVALSKNNVGRVVEGRLDKLIRRVDPADYLSWRDGRLAFEDTPFRQAAAELERWYDLSITIDNPALARRPLTASFKDESEEAVLQVLAAALDARYERSGSNVNFRLVQAVPDSTTE
jgi:ferric-dicitrate binding protein FerR (iron transport regulator)